MAGRAGQEFVQGVSAFAIGDVFARGFAVFLRYLIPFSLIGGIAMIPPAFVVFMGLDYVFPVWKLMPEISRATAAYFRLSTVFSTLLQIFSAGIILSVALRHLAGERPSWSGVLTTGSRCFPVMTGVGLLHSSCFTFGYLLVNFQAGIGRLIGAAIMGSGLLIAVRWFVASSVVVAERRNVLASLSRAATLTRGHRRKLLGMFVLVYAPYLLAQSFLPGFYPMLGRVGIVVVNYLFVGAYTGLSLAIGAVIYRALRQARDGADPKTVAAIFA